MMIEENKYKYRSLWKDAFFRLSKDKLGIISLLIVFAYGFIALLVASGLLASDWSTQVGATYVPPSFLNLKTILGTDVFGQSVLLKVIQGIQVAMSVGFITALISILIGVFLGAIAGYYGGWVDEIISWFYTTISSIPNIILLVAITFALGKGMLAVYCALGVTMWVHICRMVRSEVIRHKNREYVLAASAIGGGDMRKLFVHILPNVMHIVIIQFSLLFQSAIKAEVILSYLGLGVQGRPSWGTMIDDAKLELARGVWWQLASATAAMLILVLAFNLLGDALRDALDPKLKGK